jgi:HEAT repeat protein
MIRAWVRDRSEISTYPLVVAINETADPAIYRELAIQLLKEPEAIRACAAQILGDADNPEALETLEPLLGDPSPVVRLRSAAAVANYGAIDAMVPALAELIKGDPSAQVRLLAVHALFIIREKPNAAAALRVALVDSDANVRAAARSIIDQCRGPNISKL